MNKPANQTTLLSHMTGAMVDTLAVRYLPGVGKHLEKKLIAQGLITAYDIRVLEKSALIDMFGVRIGNMLYALSRGQDVTPVRDKGPPKSIGIEDSMKGCMSLANAEMILRELCGDLTNRLYEDAITHKRRPKTFVLSLRCVCCKLLMSL